MAAELDRRPWGIIGQMSIVSPSEPPPPPQWRPPPPPWSPNYRPELHDPDYVQPELREDTESYPKPKRKQAAT
jgi:hypothetical protein